LAEDLHSLLRTGQQVTVAPDGSVVGT